MAVVLKEEVPVQKTKREPRERMGPRVELTIRVQPEVHQGIRQMAEQQGISMTRLLAGLMEREVVRAEGAKAS